MDWTWLVMVGLMNGLLAGNIYLGIEIVRGQRRLSRELADLSRASKGVTDVIGLARRLGYFRQVSGKNASNESDNTGETWADPRRH